MTFPITEKICVNGPDEHSLFKELKKGQDVAWNFEKFLVGPTGELIERFARNVKPESIGAKL